MVPEHMVRIQSQVTPRAKTSGETTLVQYIFLLIPFRMFHLVSFSPNRMGHEMVQTAATGLVCRIRSSCIGGTL
jgi:hypothetical protein